MSRNSKLAVRAFAALFVVVSLAVIPWLIIAPHAFLPASVQTTLGLLQKAMTALAPAPIPRLFQAFDALASVTGTSG